VSKDDALAQIQHYLATMKPGEVSDNDVCNVEAMLSGCWDQLQGSDGGGMAAYKLGGRTEEMQWKPPTLSFNIERHGAMVNGSSRAEVQRWSIDLDRKIAELATGGRRQKFPMDKPLDVKPLAAEIAAFINAGREDQRLKWYGADCVRIATGKVIPTTNKQTTRSRRKRFAAELEGVLVPFGWQRKSSGTHLVFERLKWVNRRGFSSAGQARDADEEGRTLAGQGEGNPQKTLGVALAANRPAAPEVKAVVISIEGVS